MIRECQSGDLLLFNTNNTMAYLQRKLLSTEYDHVALLIKSDAVYNDVYLLEAVDTGVRLIRWSDITAYIGPEPDKLFS